MTRFQIGAVQRACAHDNSECKRDLDSKLQRCYGPLNTRQTYAVCGTVSLRIAPSQSNDCAGDFSLHRRTCSIPSTVKARSVSSSGLFITVGRLPKGQVNVRDRMPSATEKLIAWVYLWLHRLLGLVIRGSGGFCLPSGSVSDAACYSFPCPS